MMMVRRKKCCLDRVMNTEDAKLCMARKQILNIIHLKYLDK